MIKFENTKVIGWESAIRGMRNPMNSWNLSDSTYVDGNVIAGEKDYKLMMKLRNNGANHRKYLRMINVYVDITAPLYWWKQFDTYKVGTVANSCSTMHKIMDKEFTMDDFSFDTTKEFIKYDTEVTEAIICDVIWLLNHFRREYLTTKDKKYWNMVIELLPESYNQKRTCMINYETLLNIYEGRKNHKLKEWHDFCGWIVNNLPLPELIAGEEDIYGGKEVEY